MPIPTDPFLSSQWYLGNPDASLLDLNVRSVWDRGYGGSGIRTVVIDDAFDYNHSDLAPNYNQGFDYDFEDGDLDPFGFVDEEHGTAVAGIIGADDNGTGAVGVAFDTNLIGYRVVDQINDRSLQNVRERYLSCVSFRLGRCHQHQPRHQQ